MSTRAQIAIHAEPEAWTPVHVHFDGSPAHMLPALARWRPETSSPRATDRKFVRSAAPLPPCHLEGWVGGSKNREILGAGCSGL